MRSRSSLSRLPAAAVILLLTSLLAPAQQRQRPPEMQAVQILPPQAPPPLVYAGPEPDLEILFTSEVMGYYQPCG